MALGELIWTGRAWPAAEIVGRTGDDFTIKTSGKGRPLELVGPAAWWRNFSELNLEDSDAIIGFVRRHGDPFGQLSQTTQGDTAGWAYVVGLLKLAASCWTRIIPPTSLCTVWDNGYVIDALLASPLFVERVAFVPHVGEVGTDVTARRGVTMRIIPENLAAYMITSAILHLEDHVSMAPCEHCGDWFVERRRGTQFCSASCRAASSTSKKEKK
ncbi:hypothetical protein [Mesorhizobium muleiense]|uniref:hypothetical protein n=1 Tax=Mesorhizobium muleiense TaxID=1004279 RepID=UPI001F1B0040|nr:hypothetical protein [Mesorhizobium muleiense]MCF6110834.1 hypothetical protein [Mesorhizobium muleiense]